MTPAKPIRWPGLRPGGRCGCSTCLAEEARDNEQRDKALAQVVYEAGIDQLRAAALDRVPAFTAAFRG